MTSLSPAQVGTNYDVRFSYGGTPAQPNTNFTYTGQSWFGPLPPLHPIAPPDVAGRAWDFIPGFNLTTTPRQYEVVDFTTLHNLAESYDPLHLVIERRKDQIIRIPWTIRMKHDGPKTKRPKFSDLKKSDQERITALTDFVKRPDGEFTYRNWIRNILDDFFITDAATVYCARNRGGDLVALQGIDGSTIKRVIDDWGRTPRPIDYTGPFQWNGETIDQNNFAVEGFKLFRGKLYPPAYQQVLKGLPAVNYSTFELLYRPFNIRPGKVYGYSPVEQVFTTVSIALRRQFSQLEYYREGNMPEGIVRLPETWTPDQIQRYQDYWDNLLSGNLGARRHIKFVPGTGANMFTPMKEPPLKNEFDEWLARVICLAFSYPPNALISIVNRATAQQHDKTAEEEGLGPIKEWVCDLFNEVLVNEFGADDLEYAYQEEDEVDQEKQSTILVNYVTNGIMKINEAREILGQEPDPNPVANELIIKTATGFVRVDANELDQLKEKQDLLAPPEPANAAAGGGKGDGPSGNKSGGSKASPPAKTGTSAKPVKKRDEEAPEQVLPKKRFEWIKAKTQELVDQIEVDRKHQVPLLAGAHQKLRTNPIVYIDEDVPKSLKSESGVKFDPTLTLPWHEVSEWILMEEGDDEGNKLSYDDAHEIANQVEAWFVQDTYGLGWSDYNDVLEEYVKEVEEEDEARVPKRVPLDLYEGPYESRDEAKALKELKAALKEEKKSEKGIVIPFRPIRKLARVA